MCCRSYLEVKPICCWPFVCHRPFRFPHTLISIAVCPSLAHPPVPSAVLAPHIDIEPRRPRRRCLRGTCPTECTLCAHVHTAAQCPPHTIQIVCTHRCIPATVPPTTSTHLCHGSKTGPVQQQRLHPPVFAQVLALTFSHTHCNYQKHLHVQHSRTCAHLHAQTSSRIHVLPTVLPFFHSSHSRRQPLSAEHSLQSPQIARSLPAVSPGTSGGSIVPAIGILPHAQP